MAADEYDQLKKVQLQRLARVRGLDPEGTVPVLRERLRQWDTDNEGEEEEEQSEYEGEEYQLEDEEEDEEEDEDEEETAPTMALASPGEELKEGFFRFTIHAGNPLFFGDPIWHAANEELALLEAGRAGYKYLRSMGDMEYLVDGNSVHYQFPAERL